MPELTSCIFTTVLSFQRKKKKRKRAQPQPKESAEEVALDNMLAAYKTKLFGGGAKPTAGAGNSWFD
jgi:hypothetical protein